MFKTRPSLFFFAVVVETGEAERFLEGGAAADVEATDVEETGDLTTDTLDELLVRLTDGAGSGAKAIILSDYGKGVVNCATAQAASDPANDHTLSANFLAGEHARAILDHSATADFLSAVLAKNPDDRELLQTTLLALVHEGRFAEALPIAQRLDKQGVEADIVTLVLGINEFKQGNPKAAIDLISKLLRCFVCHARSMPAPSQRSQGYRR